VYSRQSGLLRPQRGQRRGERVRYAARYGDVVSTAEILSYFAHLPNNLFNPPAGTYGSSSRIKEAVE